MCVCERFIYSHDRSAYSAAGKSHFLVQYTLQRKFETNIPRKGIARKHSPKNSCVCERIPTIDLPFLLQESLVQYTAKNRKFPKQIFPEKELHAATVPISKFSCVSVSDLYIPTIDLPILLQEIM